MGGSGSVLEAPALVAGLDDVAVVGDPVEHGRGHLGIAEHLGPFAEAEIGGDDEEVVGCGVRITSGGTPAFILTYRIEAGERRLTIGAWPDWSVTAAREEASSSTKPPMTGPPMTSRF